MSQNMENCFMKPYLQQLFFDCLQPDNLPGHSMIDDVACDEMSISLRRIERDEIAAYAGAQSP
jgi:hypothetical protein